MINIEIDKVFWAQNVSAGKRGEFGKSIASGNGVRLRYLGHGVLVECDGMPDKLVPIAQVLHIEAAEKLTPEQWAGVDAEVLKIDMRDEGDGSVKAATVIVPTPKKPGPKPKA